MARSAKPVDTVDLAAELERLRQSDRIRSALLQIFEEASSSKDLRTFGAKVHAIMRDLVAADSAFVAVYDTANSMVRFPYFADEKDPEPPARPLGHGLTDLVLRRGETFQLKSPGSPEIMKAGGAKILGAVPSDWIGVPLRSEDEIIGVLAVQSYAPGAQFTQADRDVVEQVSRQVCVALERKLALERLRDSEHRNRAMLMAIPDLIFVMSRDGYYLDFKAAREKDLALPPTKVIGSHITQTGFSPEHLERLTTALEQAIATGQTQDVFYDLTTPKGPGHWEARIARLDDQRAMMIVRDVTDQRKSEKALRENEAHLRKILEVLPFGVWLLDAHGKILYGNAEGIAVWGGARYVTPDQFEEYKAWWPQTGERVRAGEWAGARVAQTGYAVLNEELEIETFDGARKVILNSAIPVRDSLGQVQCIIAVNFDITAHKRAEEHRSRLEAQILQAQKLESLGVLAGGIAHDFNNLLVGILGNADLALSELPASSAAQHYLQDLKKAAIRASELTNQMLAYSGKGRFVIEALNVNDLVQEMSHLLKVSISKRAVLKYNFFENLPLIEADPTQIRQVVMNLIINASDAIGNKSGVISLSTGVAEVDADFLATCQVHDHPAPGYFVQIEVSDTGCGMDEDTIKRIFDPFFTTKFTGRGLGLAAVMGIARGHRGAIRVHSEPGKGSTFLVLLPCASHALEAQVRVEKPSGKTQRGEGLILVVDDEESVRSISKIMLERHGFKVITAKDGREALKVFQKRSAELVAVVLDMTMPHMGGEETFQKMLEIRPDVRVILASGYTEQEATAHFVGKGLAGFIQKPFQLAEFIQKICSVTAR